MNTLEKNNAPPKISMSLLPISSNNSKSLIVKAKEDDSSKNPEENTQIKIDDLNSRTAIMINSIAYSDRKITNDPEAEKLTNNFTKSLNNEEVDLVEDVELNIPQKIVSKSKFSAINKTLNEGKKNYKKILINAQKVLKGEPNNSSKKEVNKLDLLHDKSIEPKKIDDEKTKQLKNDEAKMIAMEKAKKQTNFKNNNQRPRSSSKKSNMNKSTKKSSQKGRKIKEEKSNNKKKNKIEYVKKEKTNDDFIDKEKEKILNELLNSKEISKSSINEENGKLSDNSNASQCSEIFHGSRKENGSKEINASNDSFKEINCDDEFFSQLDKEIDEEALKNDCYLLNLTPYSEYIKKLIFDHLEDLKKSKRINYQFINIVIYGSNATQLSIENSDIDFAIEGFHGYFREDLIQLLFMLEERYEGQPMVISHNIISDANVHILKLVLLKRN